MNISLSYTFSKALDEADTYSTQVDAFIPVRSRNYGPAVFDRRHTFSANYHLSLPKLSRGWRSAPSLASGWEVSGVTRMSSGGYFTPSYSLVNSLPAPSGSTSKTARVDVIDPSAPLTSRFAPPAQGRPAHLGNLGRNTVLGPGIDNWDVSLYRQLKITERLGCQLRFETYTTLNHTQFSTFDQTLKFDATGKQVNPLFACPMPTALPEESNCR